MPGLRPPLCLDANSALSHKHSGCKYTETATRVQAITMKMSLADRKPRAVYAEYCIKYLHR